MARNVNLGALLNVYHVGSHEWEWQREYVDLSEKGKTKALIESIKESGIREPILLGDDGRVWDGHHRIVAAMHLGLRDVPVMFSGEVRNGE